MNYPSSPLPGASVRRIELENPRPAERENIAVMIVFAGYARRFHLFDHRLLSHRWHIISGSTDKTIRIWDVRLVLQSARLSMSPDILRKGYRMAQPEQAVYLAPEPI